MARSNVILIGMMGSGKTTVGRLVAAQTGREFIDLDEMIVQKAGKPISQVFDDEGEERFRDMETEALREIAGATHAVVATGGGVAVRADNRRLLKELGVVIWLDAPASELLQRIGDDESRPMLRGGEPAKKLEFLQNKRRENYADASDIHLDTTEFSPEEITERISLELEKRGYSSDALFSSIVTIDGPVGSGKSALARSLAERLSYTHVDTGAMYRCVALEAIRKNIPFDDHAALAVTAHAIDIKFADPISASKLSEAETAFGTQRVLLNGEDVTDAIRAPELAVASSEVARAPGVRGEMAQLQREMGLRGRSVLEGRDISTVVLPEARWKIYLVAALEERVMRRRNQQLQHGDAQSPDDVRNAILSRDEADRNRAQGALKLADDAMIVDTTGIPLEEVVDTLTAMIGGESLVG